MPRNARRWFAWIAALAALAGCTSFDEERWTLYNENGVQAFNAGNFRDALDNFDLALTHRPQDPVLLFNAGQCQDRLGNVSKAEQYYNYCIQLDAKNGDAHLALYTLYYRTGRAALANEKIQDWLRQQPTSPEPYVADAWRLRQEKNYPQAQARVQQALSINPHNRRAMTEQAVLYEAQDMPDRAYSLYEQILESDKNQTEIAARLAELKAKGVTRPVPYLAGGERIKPLALP